MKTVICPECGLKMKKDIRLVKGNFNRRSMWRFKCSCGHTEARLGMISEREDVIAYGLLDEEIDVPKYPDVQ